MVELLLVCVWGIMEDLVVVVFELVFLVGDVVVGVYVVMSLVFDVL